MQCSSHFSVLTNEPPCSRLFGKLTYMALLYKIKEFRALMKGLSLRHDHLFWMLISVAAPSIGGWIFSGVSSTLFNEFLASRRPRCLEPALASTRQII